MKKSLMVVVLLFIGILIGIALCERLVTAGPLYPYHQLVVTNPDGRTYKVDVLLDLEKLIKEHGDDSKLLRYVDQDARVIIYLTQNSTGDMFTSMQAVPSAKISVWSAIYQRLWK